MGSFEYVKPLILKQDFEPNRLKKTLKPVEKSYRLRKFLDKDQVLKAYNYNTY